MVAFTYDEMGVRDVVGVFRPCSSRRPPSPRKSPASPALRTRWSPGSGSISMSCNVSSRMPISSSPTMLALTDPSARSSPRLRRETLGVLGLGSGLDWPRLRGHEARLSRRPVRRLSQRTPSSRRLPCPSGSSHAFASHPGDAAVPAAAGVVTTGAPLHPRAWLAVPHEGRSEGPRYRWSDGVGGKPKCWWREITEDAYDEEARFLEEEIHGGSMNAHVDRLTACERFKA